jgi:hypothetical protein
MTKNQQDDEKSQDDPDLILLREGLDQALINIDLMKNAVLLSPPPALSNVTDSVKQFSSAFLRGEIQPFYDQFEDSDTLYDLLEVNPSLYGQLAGITLKYTYRNAFTLTAGLTELASDALPEQMKAQIPLVVYDQSGAPLHSVLGSTQHDWVLDANGVRTRQQVIERYERYTGGGHVLLRPTTTAQLIEIAEVGQDEVSQAIQEFDFLASFMFANKEELAKERVFDDEPSFDDQSEDFEP